MHFLWNYVAPAVRADGTEVVLKLGPLPYELMTEVEALRLYDGHGSVALLDADVDQGAMMLERLKPGAMLLEMADDERATSIAAQVMTALRRSAPPDHPFPTISEWFKGLKTLRDHFDGGTGPLPSALVERAETVLSELIESMGEPVLLHGDVHHYNILSAEREPWFAIDPKGIVGEAEYEVGAFLHNRLDWTLEPARVVARRMDQFADELGFERERISGWALAQAVLSVWWSYEDHGHVSEEELAYAELLAGL